MDATVGAALSGSPGTSAGSDRAAPDFTMLVCTFNRAHDLAELLDTAIAQGTADEFTYEIVVVDNNSTDGTRALAESFVQRRPDLVRYFFEPRQGKSNALNTGLAAMRGHYYAIVDDDFILPTDWLLRIARGFKRHPGAAFVGGKVLPRWESTPPRWLTRDHWSALALADHGDAEFIVDSSRTVCLLACTFRADAVRSVGGYNSGLGVSAGKIGGVEDLDILQRLWAAGFYGAYLPEVSFEHKVAASRATKAYHRRWHRGHGESYADLRDASMEASRAHLWGTPIHLYRSLFVNRLQGWGWRILRADTPSFLATTRAEFAAGFIAARRRQYTSTCATSWLREILAVCRTLSHKPALAPSGDVTSS